MENNFINGIYERTLTSLGYEFKNMGYIKYPDYVCAEIKDSIDKHNNTLMKIREEDGTYSDRKFFVDFEYLFLQFSHHHKELIPYGKNSKLENLIPNDFNFACRVFLENQGYVFGKYGSIDSPKEQPVLQVAIFEVKPFESKENFIEKLPIYCFKGFDFINLYNRFVSLKQIEMMIKGETSLRV